MEKEKEDQDNKGDVFDKSSNELVTDFMNDSPEKYFTIFNFNLEHMKIKMKT
jgi:hypothetical protein